MVEGFKIFYGGMKILVNGVGENGEIRVRDVNLGSVFILIKIIKNG